ncbi:MAG: prenyltransferase [Prevotellaceae bacterium]|jgi:1,4-dihydroxy-2-naphthoate octaprenyltransferase|nr:prenyltransferase [Prevotellaceae bacterium]
MLKTIKFWFWNARPHSLPQSVMPAALALCLAWKAGGSNFSLCLGVLAVVGVALAHLSLNLFDDYFDYKVKKTDYRNHLAHKGIRSRMHKCSYLISGQATLRNLLTACIVSGGIAVLAGVIILYFRGSTVFWIAAIAAFLGIEYSAAPLRLSYKGLGEVVIGLLFGVLSMAGVYYSACGRLDWAVLFVSVPVGLLVANIIYVHSIMDFEPDKAAGKMTFAGLLGNKKAMLVALALLLSIAYLSIIAGIIFAYLSVYYLFTLLSLPLAVELFRLMYFFVTKPEQKFEPKKWYGPVGNWERLQATGIDWFMIRWLLARNLLTLFCLIIIGVILI